MWDRSVPWLEGWSLTRSSGDFTTAHVERMLRTGVGGRLTFSALPDRPHAASTVTRAQHSAGRSTRAAWSRPCHGFPPPATLYSVLHGLASTATLRTIASF